MLRIGATPAKVYKKRGQFTRLAYLAKAYQILVADDVRVQNRIKSVMRSRGVQVAGSAVYSATGRVAYLDRLLPAARPMTDILYQQHDYLTNLRSQAQKDMITEARKHAAFRCVRSCPGLGVVRTALLLPVVITPYRFASKRQFWSYCGLAVVSRSSSDWVRTRSGEWIKAPVQRTRGLNKNFNRTLKDIFKGAATTVIGQARDEPLYRHYQDLLAGGTKPNLAKLTIARQIAPLAQPGGLRPHEVHSLVIVQLWNDRIGSNRNQQRFRTPPTPWLQGRASIEILVPARPESPGIGIIGAWRPRSPSDSLT